MEKDEWTIYRDRNTGEYRYSKSAGTASEFVVITKVRADYAYIFCGNKNYNRHEMLPDKYARNFGVKK